MPRIKTIEELQAELGAKQKKVNALEAKKRKLLARVEAVDRRIRLWTGKAGKPGRPCAVPKNGRRRRGRGRSATGLAASLQQVLQKAGQAMRAKDLAKAVLQAGYKTAAKNFYGIVAAALRNKSLFRKIRRGVYAAKEK